MQSVAKPMGLLLRPVPGQERLAGVVEDLAEEVARSRGRLFGAIAGAHGPCGSSPPSGDPDTLAQLALQSPRQRPTRWPRPTPSARKPPAVRKMPLAGLGRASQPRTAASRRWASS